MGQCEHMNHMNVKEWGRSHCPWEEARAIYSAKGIDPKGVKNWRCSIIYPNRHRVVLKNNCQIFGSSVSELLFYVWSIFHLIGLRQNPFSPNEVKKKSQYFLSQWFLCILCTTPSSRSNYFDMLARKPKSGVGMQRSMEKLHRRWWQRRKPGTVSGQKWQRCYWWFPVSGRVIV